MNQQFRFHVVKNGKSSSTEWEDELVNSGTSQHTAAARANELRLTHGPEAAIMIERRGHSKTRPKMFRFRFLVKDGEMPVNDPDEPSGIAYRKIKNQTIRSRAFQEVERPKVEAEIKEMFPDAELVEEVI